MLTNDRALGEDLVQDVLIRAEARWDRIGAADAPLSYVRRMIVNEFISWRRKWSRITPHADVTTLADQATPDHADAHTERLVLADRIATLPPKQRAVLVLRFFEDLPDDDIARILRCAPSTVRTHADRALRNLRGGRSARRSSTPSAQTVNGELP